MLSKECAGSYGNNGYALSALSVGRAAVIADTLIETAKLNGFDPQAWPADTLACIPDYKIKRVDDLLPWNRTR